MNIASRALRGVAHRIVPRIDTAVRRIGATEYCPLCDSAFRFRPFGNPSRLKAQCPGCGSLERHRLLWLWLQQSGVLQRGGRILHFAPEICLARRFLSLAGIEYLSADACITHYAVPGIREMDITDIALPDANFDLVIASHILEHVPDDRRAMREVRRVLKPGGTALLLVPFEDRADTYEDWSITTPEGRAAAFGQHDHVRIYGYDDYLSRLRQSGWNVAIDPFIDTIPEHVRRNYGLPNPDGRDRWNSTIFVCR
jgi:SAM-dependent methyltransferase